MQIQSQNIPLNPTLQRKRVLNQGLERKKTLKSTFQREKVLNEGLERKTDTTGDDTKLKQVCKQMESVFVSQLLKSMRSTVQSSDLFGSEKDEAMFRDMLDDEYAKAASEQGTMGIADALYNQLSGYGNQAANTEKPLKVSGPAVDK